MSNKKGQIELEKNNKTVAQLFNEGKLWRAWNRKRKKTVNWYITKCQKKFKVRIENDKQLASLFTWGKMMKVIEIERREKTADLNITKFPKSSK